MAVDKVGRQAECKGVTGSANADNGASNGSDDGWRAVE